MIQKMRILKKSIRIKSVTYNFLLICFDKMTTSSRKEAMNEITRRFTQRYGTKNSELIEEHVKELEGLRKLNTSDITQVENKIKKELRTKI